MMGREQSTGLVTEATPRVVDTLPEWAADTLDDLATAGGIVIRRSRHHGERWQPGPADHLCPAPGSVVARRFRLD